jgi:hypothetical protein
VDEPLSQRDRMAVLDEPARIEGTLAQISGWLPREHDRAAVLLEDAWRDVLAAQCLIDRDPARVKQVVPDGRALAAGNGYQGPG